MDIVDQTIRRDEFRPSPSRLIDRGFCKCLPTSKLRDYEDIPKITSDRGKDVTLPGHVLWINLA